MVGESKDSLSSLKHRVMSRLSELEKKRDSTRAALNEKLNALEDRVRSSIDDARQAYHRLSWRPAEIGKSGVPGGQP